ncbi:MAG: hypothetical protein OEM26_00815 [Saprospiraceae bacterium]|nr:hypothetical protein [Saprospiraceae bacterium]
MEKTQLYNPDGLQLDNLYRGLPNGGMIEITVDRSLLTQTLNNLEAIGYIAMEIRADLPLRARSVIKAYKGKHGPCFDTGRRATYRGAALAALDDDNHLLIAGKERAVCEKTATIYQLSPFRNLIAVKESSSSRKASLTERPTHFQNDSFENDQETLYQLVSPGADIANRSLLFYPGPFRLLILADGTVVRRGQVSAVPQAEASRLIKMDGLQNATSPAATDPEFFQELYTSQGSKWLVSNFQPVEIDTGAEDPDFSSLRKVHPKLKKRLTEVIEKQKKYFILTGSDPLDTFGCCPSEEVGAANQLVGANVLSACRQDTGPQECPVTIYAFRDEIFASADDLEFKPNVDLRKSVNAILRSGTGSVSKKIIRWILLSFVVVSLLFAYKNFINTEHRQNLDGLFSQISPDQDDQLLVVLFHYEKRCPQCTRMEFLTQSVLQDHFGDAVDRNMIKFDMINMDQIDYRDLTRESGLFAATMFLLSYQQGELKQTKILEEAWNLYLDDEAFKRMLTREVNTLLVL